MAQVFPSYANTVARATLVAIVLVVTIAAFAGVTFYRSGFVFLQGVTIDQEVPFSHKHHVAGLGIDCRYCHTSVETGPFAGIPPTETCMTCHSQVWNDAPILAPVRDSWSSRSNPVPRPLEWVRVHDVPDFVYFDHSIHINKGVSCESCHGRVDQMPLMRKEHSLQMQWCLQCHRAPERFIRPREDVLTMGYTAEDVLEHLENRAIATAYEGAADTAPESGAREAVGADLRKLSPEQAQLTLGKQLVEEYGIKAGQITDCSTCHR